jgi:hypothetical protein
MRRVSLRANEGEQRWYIDRTRSATPDGRKFTAVLVFENDTASRRAVSIFDCATYDVLVVLKFALGITLA